MILNATIDQVNDAIRKIQEAGGTINFDDSRGMVSVKGVDAIFSHQPSINELSVKITDMPWYASTSDVEKEIRKFFA